MSRMTIEEVAKNMKEMYEEAIVRGGRLGVHSLIRSKKLIECLHEYIKQELIYCGVDPSKIIPPEGDTKPEVQMAGFLKKKNQDICILCGSPTREKIEEGALMGKYDKVSKSLMNRSISINIRSQLSSIGKNFDTLYERTFAEALNLHLRAPGLIMGEVYLVPLVAYDPKKINRREIGFKEPLPIHYITSFQALNNRENSDIDEHKYERVCLLIIDFRRNPPLIVDSMNPFVEEGLLGAAECDKYPISKLTINNFVPDILNSFKNRNGSIEPLKAVSLKDF